MGRAADTPMVLGTGNYAVVMKIRRAGRTCAVKLCTRGNDADANAVEVRAFQVLAAFSNRTGVHVTPALHGTCPQSDFISHEMTDEMASNLGGVSVSSDPRDQAIFMDAYEEDLATWIARHTGKVGGAFRWTFASIMMQVLIRLGAISSLGLRHNDLLFRNVVLRRRPRGPTRGALLSVGDIDLYVPPCQYDVALVDFGLASGDAIGRGHSKFSKRFRKRGDFSHKRHPIQSRIMHPSLVDMYCLLVSLHLQFKTHPFTRIFKSALCARYPTSSEAHRRIAASISRQWCLDFPVQVPAYAFTWDLH